MAKAPRATQGPGDLDARRDRRAIEAIARGDEDAFRELFARYAPAAKGLATRVIGDQAIAEEVVQDVFLAVWNKARSYDAERGAVRSWILMQTHHRAVDIVRAEDARRRRSEVHAGPQQEARAPEDVVEEVWLAERRAAIQAAWGELTDDQRQVLELSYFKGMSQSEVAAATDTPLGTVKSRALAGLRTLRRTIGRDDR